MKKVILPELFTARTINWVQSVIFKVIKQTDNTI